MASHGFVKNGGFRIFPGRTSDAPAPQATQHACKEPGCGGQLLPKGAYYVCSATEEHWTIMPSVSRQPQTGCF